MGVPGITVNGDGNAPILSGTAGDDAFAGSNIAEVFQSGLGDDVVFAGDGNDYVYADMGNDYLNGSSGSGDRIDFGWVNVVNNFTGVHNFVGVTFDLNKTKFDFGELGKKTILGFEHVNGSYGHDKISGNNGANEIYGIDGNDRVLARGGSDVVVGGLGKDTLNGGNGADTLAGKFVGDFNDSVRDVFVYRSTKESGLTDATRDVIWGYFENGASHADKIDLSDIDANGSGKGNGKFSFIGTNEFSTSAAGQVRFIPVDATTYVVLVDTDRDIGAEMSFVVRSVSPLQSGDFIL
jgi:serralysin